MCFCIKFTSYLLYLSVQHIFRLSSPYISIAANLSPLTVTNTILPYPKYHRNINFFSEFSHQAYYPSFCIPSLIPCFCSSKIYIFFFLNKSATDMQGIQVDIKLHREFSYLRCFKHNILKSANQQLQLNLSNNTVETISRDHWHWYCASFLTWNGSKY